jgi:hypothetical protein
MDKHAQHVVAYYNVWIIPELNTININMSLIIFMNNALTYFGVEHFISISWPRKLVPFDALTCFGVEHFISISSSRKLVPFEVIINPV